MGDVWHTMVMNVRKYRWSRVYESAEEELVELLAAKNITATRHELDSYESLNLPAHDKLAHIWSAQGAAIFVVGGKRFSLQPGDVLDVPAGETCDVTTSLSDFAWYDSYE